MKALLVVAQNGYQPVEYSDTRSELEKEGITVEIASFEKGEATGADESKIEITESITEVDVNKYEAVVLIGGPGAAKQFIGNEDIKNLVKNADNSEKIIGAICIAPIVLAEAQILNHRKATVWNLDGKQQVKLECNGAKFVDTSVVQDTRIITANGSAAAKEFGKTIAKTIKEGVEHLK